MKIGALALVVTIRRMLRTRCRGADLGDVADALTDGPSGRLTRRSSNVVLQADESALVNGRGPGVGGWCP